ncbi:hypothetical protein BJ085DRAFT_34717 [Dimargaris cristalligena]|uniref:Uncharacterized protein n=1 Tax=Dimargaris cristalligena TaxID=215637 RepID=A0A4P9ZIW4_9FUNG|nr:hypothetical protein BJ085DRAFT_34717 [Dimargaris cristalligena]|eukprot:RKP33127.1 hypothetical protein BJ085DRAFT_34717 [Dimargaris cristalligena]
MYLPTTMLALALMTAAAFSHGTALETTGSLGQLGRHSLPLHTTLPQAIHRRAETPWNGYPMEISTGKTANSPLVITQEQNQSSPAVKPDGAPRPEPTTNSSNASNPRNNTVGQKKPKLPKKPSKKPVTKPRPFVTGNYPGVLNK